MDFLEEEFEEILNIFREESEEHIQKLNQSLLRLEVNPKDNATISELFREAHSLKGAARMINMNDIQLVAHKIEDIFGLARDHALIITSEIVDVLCKAVDCISSIVDESIRTKGACHFVNVENIIKELEDIKKNYAQNPDIPAESFVSSASIKIDIVNLITQVKESIEKLKKSPTSAALISELYKLIIITDESSQSIDDYKVRELIQDIKIKLESVVKGSGILIIPEIEEIEEYFDSFIENIEKIQPGSTSPKENIVIKSEISNKTLQQENNNIDSDLDYINNNLVLLSENSQTAETAVDLIKNKLQKIINTNISSDIKIIINKILEIIIFSKESGKKLDIEITEVIKQSFNTVQTMILSPVNTFAEDPELIIQRLAILQQMLKISLQAKPQNIETTNVTVNTDFLPVNQKTEMLSTELDFSSKESIEERISSENTTIKTLRVDTKKLDQLVRQVGELIIAKIKAKEHLTEVEKITQSIEEWYREWYKVKNLLKHLDRKPVKPNELLPGTSVYSQNKNINSYFDASSEKLISIMNQMNALYKIIQEDDTKLNLIVNELEERIKSVRVLPLATIFHMFPRMVRDISREKNKNIELAISGSETSVDKKIIEDIKSPLIHIIRNAIDHGIEDTETRIKNGKNPTGKIFLSAYHLENSVLIEITDDGKGINLDTIKTKVLQKGLLTNAELQTMTDEQIMNIIFWPGFSTGDVITDISGRGVGLDIVYTKITQLNGKVNIKSAIGEGCKVSIQLPVTMATIKAFLAKVNDQIFAIPTNVIKTALLIKRSDIFYKEGQETIIVDNKTVPICKLSRILEMPDRKADYKKIVVIVIQAENIQVGFIIDKLIGDQEILHKNLTPPLLRVRNVAGATTLASGELCLILNVNDLVKSAYLNFGKGQKELVINEKNKADIINKQNILVIDDSVTTRILERNILKTAGYNVTVATNGLDALTKIMTEKFDLIVTDVEMPEINGFELTERLKKDEKFKNIPVILVTSLASDSDRKKGLGLGANAYITKGGFNQGELLFTIKKLLAKE